MRVDPDILHNWKYRKLVELSGFSYPIVWLINLWGNCQNRRNWRFPLNTQQIAQICNYEGKADSDTFVDWLINSGFLDRKCDHYSVHEWEEYNASLLNSWQNGAKGGRPRGPATPPRKYQRITNNRDAPTP